MDESPKSLDLQQIYSKLRSLGADEIEIYAELRKENRLDIWDRVHHCASIAEKGLSIHCRKAGTSFRFQCGAWDTDSVLKVIEGRKFRLDEASNTPKERVTLASTAPTSAPHAVTILHLARAAFAQGQGKVVRCDLFFDEEITQFWVSRDESGWVSGSHARASIRSKWKVEQEEGPGKYFTWECKSLDPAKLLQALKTEHPLFDAVKKSAAPPSAWPAPQGELPIYWSAEALSKVTLPFVRAFEADLFLKQESFLHEMNFPANWKLELTETLDTVINSESDTKRQDAEGATRIPLTLLKNGKPRGLACDRKSAVEMQVEATGHARRQSFRQIPLTGLWNVLLNFENKKTDLLECSPWGVWIEDVEILESSTKTGIICLKVTRAFLLHEKAKGEAIEPVVFEMAVQDFMGVIEAAGETNRKFGFEVQKEGQAFVTEIQLPDAFTPRFPYPGTVSSDTYW